MGAHPNGLSINRDGTLLLAAAHDGTVKVLAIEGKSLKLLDSVKVGEKRMSGVAFTHDGKAAIVALRDREWRRRACRRRPEGHADQGANLDRRESVCDRRLERWPMGRHWPPASAGLWTMPTW
jgi:hypothetical protein